MATPLDNEPGDSAALLAEEPAATGGFMARWLANKRLARSFWLFLLASCLFNTGMFIYVLLYNLYLLDIGYKEDFLGLMSSFSTAGTVVGTFGAVILTRRLGLQRAVMVCLASTATIAVLRALVSTKAALLGLAGLGGIFFALWAISITVIIAQTTAAALRPFAFSVYLATVIGIGIVADPVGGHLPIWLSHLLGIASAAESKQMAMLVGCVFIYLAVLPVLFMRLGQEANHERLKYPRSAFVVRFMLAVAVLNIATASFNPFANAYFSQQLKVPVDQIGLIFSGGQIAQVIAILLSPLILNKLGIIRGVMLMEVAAGVSLAVLATGPPAFAAALAFSGYVAFQWMDEPAMESLLMTRVAPDERSGASALMYMTIFASGAIAAPTAGKGLTHFGYPLVLTVAAFLLLLGGVLFWLLLKKYDKDAD